MVWRLEGASASCPETEMKNRQKFQEKGEGTLHYHGSIIMMGLGNDLLSKWNTISDAYRIMKRHM